jgi:hypothetical protein
MEEIRQLDKLSTHLLMESHFTPDNDKRLADIEHDLDTVTALIEMLEGGDESAIITAQGLLEKYSGLDQETQAWSEKVINQRFSDYVSVPHTRQIEKFSGPIVSRNDAEARLRVAENFSFRFEGLSQLLQHTGFWEKIGAQSELDGYVNAGSVDWSQIVVSPSSKNFEIILNVLNGSAPINYEAAFPDLQANFDLLKTHKHGLDDEAIAQKKAQGKSPLSPPDILSSVISDAIYREVGLDDVTRQDIAKLNALVLDQRMSNAERIGLYKQLNNLYASLPHTETMDLIQQAMKGLALPDGHKSKITNIDDIHGLQLDAIVPLGSSDDGLNAVVARRIVNAHPESFMIPSGGRAPHELATGVTSQVTEADMMVALAMIDDLPSHFPWQYPGTPDLTNVPPLNQSDVLAPDTTSHSTQTNASETTLRLQALQNIEDGKPLNVVVVTNSMHSNRALADFQNAISGAVNAEIMVFENADCPHLMHAEHGNMHALQYGLGEYVKRLYMCATQQKV